MPADSLFRLALQDASFSFTPRPEPIAGDLRMSWGIGILLLSLAHSRGRKASFLKLQFLAHAIRTEAVRKQVKALLRGELQSSDIPVRVEPWLNRAVSFAHGLGMVTVTKGKSVALTDKGSELAAAIAADDDVLVVEREFLSDAAKRLTEAQLVRIWRMENLL